MADTCPVVRIISTHPETQGPFVEINEEDFDAKKGHKKYVEKSETAAERKAREAFELAAASQPKTAEANQPTELDVARAELTARGITFSDALGLEDLQALLEANPAKPAGWGAAPKAGE